MSIDTTIGVLTYSKLEFLRGFFSSLYAATPDLIKDRDRYVLVVANNSEDEIYIRQVEEIASSYGATTFNFRRNRGTSAAWNAITRSYNCEKIIISNDDILFHDGWKEAVDFAFTDKNLGIAGLDGTNGLTEWKYRPLEASTGFTKNPIIYPPGSFIFFRQSCFDEIGGFDENLWIGCEEVDFSIRLMERGYDNYRIYSSRSGRYFINHYGGATGYSSPESLVYFKEKYQTDFPLTREFEENLWKIQQEMKTRKVAFGEQM